MWSAGPAALRESEGRGPSVGQGATARTPVTDPLGSCLPLPHRPAWRRTRHYVWSIVPLLPVARIDARQIPAHGLRVLRL